MKKRQLILYAALPFVLCLSLIIIISLNSYKDPGKQSPESSVESTVEIPAPPSPQDSFLEFEYVLLDDGTYGVKGKLPFDISGSSIDIEIPSEYNGISVTRILEGGFEACYPLKSVKLPESITVIEKSAFAYCNLQNVYFSETPLKIEDNAFAYCRALKTLEFKAFVQYVGNSAFDSCSSLSRVHFYEGVYSIETEAFKNCNSLLSLTIENIPNKNLTSSMSSVDPNGNTFNSIIKSNAFSELKNLTNVYIGGDGSMLIGKKAFSDCQSLTNITVDCKEAVIFGDYAFANCENLFSVSIAEGATKISSGMFSGCKSLKILNIPQSVTEIGMSAFEDCASLAKLTISSSVTHIGSAPFRGCTALEELTLPFIVVSVEDSKYNSLASMFGLSTGVSLPKALKSITLNGGTLSANAFKNCVYIEEISLGDGVSIFSTTSSPFSSCVSLRYIKLGKGIQNLSSKTFAGLEDISATVELSDPSLSLHLSPIGQIDHLILHNLEHDAGLDSVSIFSRLGISSVKEVTVKSGKIDQYVFKSGKNLQKVTVNDGVSGIDSYSFYSIASLNEVHLGKDVTYINSYAFRKCTNLKAVYLTNSVTKISNLAFGGCENLTDIYFNGTREEWEAIEKESSWDSATPKYTVHCLNGNIIKKS